MLISMGAPIQVLGRTIHSERPETPLKPLDITVPGDISSAAFLLAAASITPDSHITIKDVGINPTRTGIVDALSKWVLRSAIATRAGRGEPHRQPRRRTSAVAGATFGGERIVTMIDELPTLAVAATQAEGRTIVRDAQELRVKETDRIATTVSELRKMGARIQATEDGFIVDGPTPLYGATVDSHDDHRLAMALAVAGLIAKRRHHHPQRLRHRRQLPRLRGHAAGVGNGGARNNS
ncbi:MAG: hypothetical protein R2856_20465 [Caldilineaceae bacterium]